MACKSDVVFNFARASEHDDIVYGAARPGAAGQRCFNPEDKVTAAEVEEWASFMKGHGIRRVVSLLTNSELATYVEPPAAALQPHFSKVGHVDMQAPGAAEALAEQLREAVAAGEKVVVHCWGGGGRTGLALASWLVRQYGLTPEQAAAQVEVYGKSQGASRRANVAQLQGLLGEPKL